MRLVLISLFFLTLSLPVMAVEEIIKLVQDTSHITESLDEIQVKKLYVDSNTATYWLTTAELQNDLDDLKKSYYLVDCDALGKLTGHSPVYLINKDSKLVLVVRGVEIETDVKKLTLENQNKLQLQLRDNTEIAIERFGRVFSGKTKDGKDVYGIVSDTYGEYKVEHGEGQASGIVSKEGITELTPNLYARGKVEAGAVIFYDKLIPSEEEAISHKLDSLDISEIVNAKLGTEAGLGYKHKAWDGELSVEIYTRFDNEKRRGFGLDHRYDVVRGQYKDEITEELALVSGVAVTNHRDIGKIYSAFSGFETGDHKLQLELSDRAVVNNTVYGPTFSATYKREIKDDLDISLTGAVPLDGERGATISFSIKKKF